MFEYLPAAYRQALGHCNENLVYELRIRAEKPIMLNYGGRYAYLDRFGISEKEGLCAAKEDIEGIVMAASEHSLYAVAEQIRQGFLTTEFGERIGLCGKGVCDRGQVLHLRDIRSLCIRIPHEIRGCAERIEPYCFCPRPRHTMIFSPPGFGKTTLLRDSIRLLGGKYRQNVLVIDERGELSAYDHSTMSDILSCIEKKTAIEYGIRAMRPDVLVTDELAADEVDAIRLAMASGVKVMASVHAEAVEQAPSGFERYIRLGEVGTVLAVYDGEKRILYG